MHTPANYQYNAARRLTERVNIGRNHMPYEKCCGINLYYEIHGSGTPVIFLNGLASGIEHKRIFIRQAAKRFQVIAPDLRGAGLSDKPKGPYTIAQMANDVYEFTRKLSLNKFCAMGFSMGGFIAMTLALDHPELIDKLILTSTAPAWKRPFPPSMEAERILKTTEVSDQLLIDLFNLIYGAAYRNRVGAENYVKERMSDPNPQPLDAYLGQLAACEGFDLFDRVSSICAPTLIATGKCDLLLPPQNSRCLHEKIRGSRLVEYDGVGHMPVDECPEKLAEDVAEFINR